MLLCSGSPVREALLRQHNHVGRGALGLLREADKGEEDEAPSPLLSEEHSMDHAIPVSAHFPYVAAELPGRLESKLADFCHGCDDLGRILIRQRLQKVAHGSSTRGRLVVPPAPRGHGSDATCSTTHPALWDRKSA